MGLWQRLLSRAAPAETRDAAGEIFSLNPNLTGGLGALPAMDSGAAAENIAAVTACVGAIAGTLATFPVIAHRAAGEGRIELSDHWLPRLLRRPSRRLTWPELLEMMLADALLSGQSYAEIIHDGAGRVVALEPIPSRHVTARVLDSGRVAYDVTPADSRWMTGAKPRRLLEDQVWTVRDRSDDGITGRSRLNRAAAALNNAAQLQAASSALWENKMMVSGIITAPGILTKQQRTEADAMLEKFRGAQRAGRVPLMEGGWAWQSIAIDPETAEMLGSRRLSTEEIASIFAVPPPIIGDLSHGTMHNVGEMVRHFTQTTLASWARRAEASFARDVLNSSANLSIELDMSSMLRGDPETRFKCYEIAIRNSILSPEECRAWEGWNKRAPADQPPPVVQPVAAPQQAAQPAEETAT